MVLKNSLTLINEFYFYISNKIRKLYLNSQIYNKKISKIDNKILDYTPSLNIFDCIIKYEKKITIQIYGLAGDMQRLKYLHMQ